MGTPLLSRLKSTKSVDGTPSQSIIRSATDSGDYFSVAHTLPVLLDADAVTVTVVSGDRDTIRFLDSTFK